MRRDGGRRARVRSHLERERERREKEIAEEREKGESRGRGRGNTLDGKFSMQRSEERGGEGEGIDQGVARA